MQRWWGIAVIVPPSPSAACMGPRIRSPARIGVMGSSRSNDSSVASTISCLAFRTCSMYSDDGPSTSPCSASRASTARSSNSSWQLEKQKGESEVANSYSGARWRRVSSHLCHGHLGDLRVRGRHGGRCSKEEEALSLDAEGAEICARQSRQRERGGCSLGRAVQPSRSPEGHRPHYIVLA